MKLEECLDKEFNHEWVATKKRRERKDDGRDKEIEVKGEKKKREKKESI